MKYLPLLPLALVLACRATPSVTDRPGFDSPGESVAAVVAALRADDMQRLHLLLGPAADDVLDSGDAAADRAGRQHFLELYDQEHRIERPDDSTAVLHVGPDDWPLPIPIVRVDGRWYLDAEEGREELIDRRIGRNELSTIQVCLALVDAQEEYASVDQDGDGLLEYAQRAHCSPGQRDGLYWATGADEAPSPLGELAAAAVEAGYDVGRERRDLVPFFGYLFRILRGQGPAAPGGAHGYLAGEHMIGGFAVVAYPAEYGVSGVCSFLVSHDGVVYEQDLGPETAARARALERFDPAPPWLPVGHEQ